MKRLICIFAAIIIISALPGTALGAPPDWTLVPIPASQSDAAPVCIDINEFSSDIAVDVNNNLYVMSNSKITRFNPAGRVDRSWGRNGSIYDEELEAANCEMLEIAADSRGYVYAHCRVCGDGGSTFIKRYAPDGKADTSWYADGVMAGKLIGGALAVDEAEPKGGIRGEDEIALDSRDNLYVLYDRQVYKFYSNGAPDKKWRTVKMKQPKAVYAEDGGVSFSNAMRIDRNGNVYLFNGYDLILTKFSATGRFLKRYKCPLYHAYEDDSGLASYIINQVAFDAAGSIYNINAYGNISKYSPKMKLYTSWCGGQFTPGESDAVQTITDFETDAAGSIYVLDKNNGVVSKYTNAGVLDLGWGANGSIGNVNSNGSVMLSIKDIISDSGGSMYAVTDYLGGGSAVIVRINQNFTFDVTWGYDVYGNFKGYKTGAFNSMTAYNGSLYTDSNADNTLDSVIKINEGKADPKWNMAASGPVWDIQADYNGCIYIAGNRITKYLPDKNVDESWGLKGKVDGFKSIGEMAADSRGCLYVSDRDGGCIVRYTPEGQVDTDWGEYGKADIPGAGDSEVYYTYFIVVDRAGNLYLSDYINNRILRYNSEGRLDTAWCSGGEWKSPESCADELLPMINPTHLMISNGRLYAIWNDKLYVMNDSAAQVGVRSPQASASEQAEGAMSTAKPLAAWRWIVSIGGLLFCAGAIFVMCLLLQKKNRKRRLAKIKSIKIAKRRGKPV